MSRLWTVVVGQLWKPLMASPRPPKTIFPVDRTMAEVGVWLYSEAKADQQWCTRRSLAQWQLDVSLWIQKRRKLLKRLPAHFTHTAVSHVLHFIAVLKTFLLNLSTEVSFLKGNKAFFSFFLCYQQFYSRKGFFMNWIRRHNNSWSFPHPSIMDLRHGTVIRRCQGRVGSFYGNVSFVNQIKMIRYQAYIGRMKSPMFIHRTRWWMAALMVSSVNQSGWLIRSAESEPQGDGYSNF